MCARVSPSCGRSPRPTLPPITCACRSFEWRLIASFVVLLNSAFCHLQLLNGPSAGLLSQPFAIGAIALASAAIFLVINLAWLGVHGFAGRVVVYVLIATDLVVVGCQAYMLAHTFAAAKRAQADSELGRS